MGKVRDFDGRWVGEGGGGPEDCLPRLAPEDRLCICPLFVSISD